MHFVTSLLALIHELISIQDHSQISVTLVNIGTMFYQQQEWKSYFEQVPEKYIFAALALSKFKYHLPSEVDTEASHREIPCDSGISSSCMNFTGKLKSCNGCGKFEGKKGDYKKCSKCGKGEK
jgi:hypothetical protein